MDAAGYRNLAIDVLRRRSRESALPDTDLAVVDTGSELLLRIAVADALRQLPDRQREVIELRYLSDLSQTDVARVGRGQRRPLWTGSPEEFVGRELDCVIVDIGSDRRPLITDALTGEAAAEFGAVWSTCLSSTRLRPSASRWRSRWSTPISRWPGSACGPRADRPHRNVGARSIIAFDRDRTREAA